MADQFSLPGFEPVPPTPRRRKPVEPTQPARHSVFFGICPSADDLPRVEALVSPWRHRFDMGGGRVEHRRLHITCCDLGGFVDAPPCDLIAAASEVAAGVSVPPFEIVFERVMRFNGSGALVLLERAGTTPLADFLKTLDHALIQAGVPVKHVGTAHMTLGYGVGAVSEPLPEAIRWKALDFVLIDSRVGAHVHDELGRWPLIARSV